MDLTEYLVRRLRDQKVKPTALSEHIGVSVPFASQILTGKRGIRLVHIPGIAAALGVPISTLFAGSDLPFHSTDAKSGNAMQGDGVSSENTPRSRNSSLPEDHRRGRTATISSETIISELFAAATEFEDYAKRADKFAANARQWADRLNELSAAAGFHQLTGEQAPGDRPEVPAPAKADGTVRRRHPPQRRRG